jgi:hypothetical protein
MSIFTRLAYRPLNIQTLIRRNMRQLRVKREAKRIAIMGLPESGDTAPTHIEDTISAAMSAERNTIELSTNEKLANIERSGGEQVAILDRANPDVEVLVSLKDAERIVDRAPIAFEVPSRELAAVQNQRDAFEAEHGLDGDRAGKAWTVGLVAAFAIPALIEFALCVAYFADRLASGPIGGAAIASFYMLGNAFLGAAIGWAFQLAHPHRNNRWAGWLLGGLAGILEVWLLLLQTQLRLLPVGLDAVEQFAQAGANALANPLSGLTDFSACAFLVTSIGFVAWIAVKTLAVIGAFPGHRKHVLAVAKAQRVFDAAKDKLLSDVEVVIESGVTFVEKARQEAAVAINTVKGLLIDAREVVMRGQSDKRVIKLAHTALLAEVRSINPRIRPANSPAIIIGAAGHDDDQAMLDDLNGRLAQVHAREEVTLTTFERCLDQLNAAARRARDMILQRAEQMLAVARLGRPQFSAPKNTLTLN